MKMRLADYSCPACGEDDEFYENQKPVCRMCGGIMEAKFPAPNISIPNNRNKRIDKAVAEDNANLDKKDKEEREFQEQKAKTDDHWHHRFEQQEMPAKIKAADPGDTD